MGGSYSLHIAYRTHTRLAGAFILTPFINYDSSVYANLADRQPADHANLPKLLCIHGKADDLLLPEWGVYVFRELTRLGVRGDFHAMPGVGHEIRMWHLLKVENWARELLPPLGDDLVHKL